MHLGVQNDAAAVARGCASTESVQSACLLRMPLAPLAAAQPFGPCLSFVQSACLSRIPLAGGGPAIWAFQASCVCIRLCMYEKECLQVRWIHHMCTYLCIYTYMGFVLFFPHDALPVT